MSGTLFFDGYSAASFGLKIGSVHCYAAPGNTAETAKIPGRIGDVPIYDAEPSVGNEIREYEAGFYRKASTDAEAAQRMAKIRAWLLNGSGFLRLQDSYEPDFYRRAFFLGDVTPDRKGATHNFQIPLRFSCDPRRYLAGAFDVVMGQGAAGALTQEIIPPTGWEDLVVYPAKPLIKFEGYGQNDATELVFTDTGLTEKRGKITFAENIGTVWFDCETLNATSQPYGGSNLNPWITDVSGDVTLRGLIDVINRDNLDATITITPRWWVR